MQSSPRLSVTQVIRDEDLLQVFPKPLHWITKGPSNQRSGEIEAEFFWMVHDLFSALENHKPLDKTLRHAVLRSQRLMLGPVDKLRYRDGIVTKMKEMLEGKLSLSSMPYNVTGNENLDHALANIKVAINTSQDLPVLMAKFHDLIKPFEPHRTYRKRDVMKMQIGHVVGALRTALGKAQSAVRQRQGDPLDRLKDE